MSNFEKPQSWLDKPNNTNSLKYDNSVEIVGDIKEPIRWKIELVVGSYVISEEDEEDKEEEIKKYIDNITSHVNIEDLKNLDVKYFNKYLAYKLIEKWEWYFVVAYLNNFEW